MTAVVRNRPLRALLIIATVDSTVALVVRGALFARLLRGVAPDWIGWTGALALILLPIQLVILWRVAREHAGSVSRAEAAERRVRVVLETVRPWLWRIDCQGRLVEASEHCREMFGWTSPELIGRSAAAMLLHPGDADRVRRVLGAEETTRSGWTDLWMHCVTRDGRDQWVLTSGVPVTDTGGRCVGFEGTSRAADGDHEAELRRETARLRVADALRDRDVRIALQPIYDVTSGVVLGAEALSRFQSVPTISPDRWFADAHTVGLGVELELLTLRLALDAAAEALLEPLYLSVNVSPRTALTDNRLLNHIRDAGFPAQRIVVEITEHESIEDYSAMDATLTALRDMGARIAVDDAGAGYASFRHIVRLRPDVIKLDRTLVAEVDHDAAKRALTAALVMFALEVDATVVAEGVETEPERAAIAVLGVDAAQGYLLGRPTTDRLEWSSWLEARVPATP